MSLALDSRYCGSVYVVRCGGRIVYGEESKLLDEKLQRVIREFTRVVVNVADVNRIYSVGIGLLVRYLLHTRNRGGDIRMTAPSDVVTGLLQITKIANV